MARVACALAAHMQKLAIGSRAIGHHFQIEPRSRILDFAVFVVASVRLAIGFEATPLIEMKKSAPEMSERQGALQALCSELIWIEKLQLFCLCGVGRH
ncbi:MAG: hypothetical protein N4A53_02435 [Pelagimonas sp.]|jgi:hypothetical protein|nr:hypothetical protein [Pelagimonas sp.]